MGRKRPPTTREEIIRRRDELFWALSKESDRGVVLVSASFLEEALEALLRARFSVRHPKSKSSINPLFDTFGPLSSFSAKLKISYATDLIAEWMYRDLEIVKKLRNNFAHSVGVARFDLPEVVQLTERLKAADLAVTSITKEAAGTKKAKKTKITNKTISKPTKANMERARFEMSVSFVGALLYFLTKILNSDAPLQDKENIIESILLAK
jgi:DNA-binding MltR family transcriptional regulator